MQASPTGLAIAVLVVVGIVGVTWVVSRRLLQNSGNATDAVDTPADSPDDPDDVSELGITDRAKSWTRARKMLYGSAAAAAVLLSGGAWRVMQTGAPTSTLLSPEAGMVTIGVTGVVLGIRFHASQNDSTNPLYVQNEQPGGDDVVRKIPHPESEVTVRDGRPVVPELTPNPILGVFHRFKLLAEDRNLRSTRKPGSDRVEHMVPDHAVELPDGGWFVRTWASASDSGETILGSPSAPADYTYSSPRSMSYAESTGQREEIRRMRIENRELRKTAAKAESELRSWRQTVLNEEFRNKEEMKEEFGEFTEQIATVLDASQDGGSDDGDDSSDSVFDGGDSE
ncbi:hypothetical protein C471_07686 [Halorubrum saccharovorum DSM 1137]|uniref:Uncharacterized protein n=1 Tax=Halorubrum saccharovorum DSM 1137 TaxID=1227484 RepID=M0E121_9EURY|nr:hypothetical protein [Halorubrum saccharovorum]ELZ40647.1 hypothetical protein C471_07686 [Halorubrum saccharovorum DSM 1137]